MPIQHTTSDLYYGDQWYLKNTGQFSGTSGIDINIEGAWSVTTGSSSIKVAVIDDGVENHDDFNGRILSGFTPRNKSTGFGLPTSSGKHGEACAGIIVATHDNTIGIAGIAPNSYIVPVNIFYDGNETVGDIEDAINWAWDEGQADVLSNSWGYQQSVPSGFDAIVQAIANARTYGRGGKGSVVVFASGNEYANVSFPASVDGVVTVGAIDNTGSILSYSNTGSQMDLVAPSGSVHIGSLSLSNPVDGIRTTDRMGTNGYTSGDYVSFNGTSAACPQIPGVSALILSVNPNLNESQVRNIMHITSTDMGTPGFDSTFGYGRVNACFAVYKALATLSAVTGSSNLCDEAIYTVSNVPSGSTVTWEIEGWCAEVISSTGNQVTVGRLDYGDFKVKAIITTACGNVEVLSNTVVAGLPYFASITDISNDGMGTAQGILCSDAPNYDNYYNTFSYSITPGTPYPVTYHYDFYGPAGLISQDSRVITSATLSSGTRVLPTGLANGSYYSLNVWLSGGPCNEASESTEYSIEYQSCNNYRQLAIYPNPANTDVKISFSADAKVIDVAKNTKSEGFTVKLFNDKGTVVKQGKTAVDNSNEITLNVSDLQNGTYFLHVIEGKTVTKKQIIVSH